MRVDWWQARREELLRLAQQQCPLYVYDEETLNEVFFDLLCLDTVSRLVYPVCLNPHPRVVGKAIDMGLDLLCESPGQLQELAHKSPQLPPERLRLGPEPATAAPGDSGSFVEVSAEALSPMGVLLFKEDQTFAGTPQPHMVIGGDILIRENAGACNPGERVDWRGREGIPEHFLPARRICQVKL